ncbi:MAG: efflux RND transporter permease subunit [Treponema sp.]|nr:efflux RND transporter permease subunit [Treponema sp.]
MKGIINLFVRRPVTVIMILAALIIAALFSGVSMPVNKLPELSVPRVTVETLYPGMAANEIRSLVTIPLEDGFSAIKGLERIQSVSRDNRSIISLDFRWGTDPMTASVLVREAVDSIYPGLPEGVKKPAVTSGDSANEPSAVIAVSSHNGNGEFARKFAEYELQARLRRIDGVGSIILAGGEINEERLEIDVLRLAALGFTPSEFTNLIARETSDIPAGNAQEGNTELVIVSSGRPDSVHSLSQIILPAGRGSFKIEDSGGLYTASAKRESIFFFNGIEAAALEVYRRPGADPLKLSRDIKKILNEADSIFSRDVKIELAADSSLSLVSGITGLIVSSALAAIAVAVVLLIFIRRLKYSLLAALSIPVSAAAGICVLYACGKSLNGMSLGGLAMGIGLVSDISVLVLDLLHRSFGENKSAPTPPTPEEIGNRVFSISGSSAASTITTALVFIPIIMLPGPIGSLFGDIAIALVTSVSAGWLYAQFFLPSLYLLLFKGKNKKPRTVVTDGSLEKKYAVLLSSLIKRPAKVFAIAIVLSAVGFFTLLMRPMVFINPDDAEEVWVSGYFPPGALLESMSETGIKASILLSGLPSVKTVYGRAGAEEHDTARRAHIDYRKEELILRCILNKEIKPQKALAEITSAMNHYGELPFSAYFPRDRAEVLLGLSSERTFVIKGKDRSELFELYETANEAAMNASLSVSFRPLGQRPELRLFPNREASAHLSLPAMQIAETLFILNEGAVAAKLEIEGRPLDIRVIGKSLNNTDTIKYLEQIPIRTAEGKSAYLGSLSRIERREAEASLARLDRSDVLYADINAGSSAKNIPSAFKRIAERADESVFERYKNSLLIYLCLILVLLYMTMGAQFESFLLPLILMMSIPFSLAGAGPALLITGAKIDSGAILGLAALFGLVINNSLILFEISDEKIKAGLSPAAAVYSGARERLKAILITMITTIFALIPLILSPLGNSQKSMASAMLGGLTASTLLSLFAIPPVLISYFKWKIKTEEK